MLFAYKRISSLGPSLDPSAYTAEIDCRSSTQTRNTIVWYQYRFGDPETDT